MEPPVSPLVDDPALAAVAAEILKAVGHPLRLRILGLLCTRTYHVGALAERLDAPQAIVSQQLRILRMRGLVASEREGGLAVYRLIQPHVRDMLRCVGGCVGLPRPT
jgi:ArsR family transcriptional regulator